MGQATVSGIRLFSYRHRGVRASMLGPPKARCLDRPVLVSLEDLVPAGDFYSHRDAALALSFVRDWVRDRYAEHG